MSALTEYLDRPRKGGALPQQIAMAIRLAAPSGRRKDVLAILDNRVAWDTVRGWRSGKRSAPYWAIERFAAALRPHVEIATAFERIAKEKGAR